MFIYNIKLDGKNLVKTVFIILSIIITIFFLYSTYKIVEESFKVQDEIPVPEVQILTTENYTNVLKVVHENLEDYLGIQISFTGYIYRLNDFAENQFVLARDMILSETESFIVGFLCEYPNAIDFPGGIWVEVTGEITKGYYHGDIPLLQISEMKQIETPTEDIYVSPPDDAYIPTSVLF